MAGRFEGLIDRALGVAPPPPPAAPVWSARKRHAATVSALALFALAASMLLPLPPLPPRLHLFGFAAVQLVLLLGIPLAAARWLLGVRPAELGLRAGAPGRWLREVGWLALAALPALVALSRVPSIRAYYPVYSFAREQPWLLVPATLAFAAYGIGWEFLFRGLLQLGTRPALGRASLLVQLVPFVLAHAHKPPLELAITPLSGLLLGVLAHRHSTILPAWLLHLACSTALNVLCLIP